MQTSSSPKKLPVPFADSGSKQDIPVDSQIGITGGRASYTDGFPPLTRTPLSAGGIPPFGTDFNGVLNDITASIRWQNAGSNYPFDAAFAASIAGYPKGAVIPSSLYDGYWLNTTEANSANPEVTNGSLTGWVPVETYGVTTVAGLAASSVTLTSLQAAKERIKLTGTLTSNINVVVPAWTKKWIVVNGATGNFTVTIKTPSGSGVTLPTGQTAAVVGDGTNVTLDNQTQNISTQVTGVVGLSRNARMTVTSASSIADFLADELIVNSALGGNQYRLKSVSARITLTTTGAGGMDTGSAPATGYVAVYVIYNPTSGGVALLGVDATSVLAPEVYGGANMPAGYTASSLVAVWPTASSQFVIGNLIGRKIEVATRTLLSSSTVNASRVSLTTTLFPLNAKSIYGNMSVGSTASSSCSVVVWGANSQVGGMPFSQTVVAGGAYAATFSAVSVTNQTIGWSSGNTAGTPTFAIGMGAYEF